MFFIALKRTIIFGIRQVCRTTHWVILPHQDTWQLLIPSASLDDLIINIFQRLLSWHSLTSGQWFQYCPSFSSKADDFNCCWYQWTKSNERIVNSVYLNRIFHLLHPALYSSRKASLITYKEHWFQASFSKFSAKLPSCRLHGRQADNISLFYLSIIFNTILQAVRSDHHHHQQIYRLFLNHIFCKDFSYVYLWVTWSHLPSRYISPVGKVEKVNCFPFNVIFSYDPKKLVYT